MIISRDIMASLDRLAPPSYACDWDNPGFLAGRSDKEVRRVLVALDVTTAVAEQAVREQADMIITHHPLVFRALKQINDQNFVSRRIVRLLQADITYYAMHTNFDAAPGCMADLAAQRLGIMDGQPLEVMGEADGVSFGIGKVGTLEKPVMVQELAEQVKAAFGLPFVLVYGAEQVEEPVTRAAVSPGSGGSMLGYACRAGAQVLVTGDIGHHEAQDMAEQHMAVIDAGHYGLEHIFIPFIRTYLEQEFGRELVVLEAEPAFPAHVV